MAHMCLPFYVKLLPLVYLPCLMLHISSCIKEVIEGGLHGPNNIVRLLMRSRFVSLTTLKHGDQLDQLDQEPSQLVHSNARNIKYSCLPPSLSSSMSSSIHIFIAHVSINSNTLANIHFWFGPRQYLYSS